MTHHVIGARNATPGVSGGRYLYPKEGGLAGFRESIGKLKRPANGFTPELSIDRDGNPRIDKGPQGPIEWVISFIKDLIYPNLQTETRQKTLRSLDQAIREEYFHRGDPCSDSNSFNVNVTQIQKEAQQALDGLGKADGIDIHGYNEILKKLEAAIAKPEQLSPVPQT